MTVIVVWLVVAVAVGILAANKGRSGIGWFILAVVISPLLAGILVLCVSNLNTQQTEATGYRKCPHCAEMVRKEAVVCRFCHSDLSPSPLIVDAHGHTVISDAHVTKTNHLATLAVVAIICVAGVGGYLIMQRPDPTATIIRRASPVPADSVQIDGTGRKTGQHQIDPRASTVVPKNALIDVVAPLPRQRPPAAH